MNGDRVLGKVRGLGRLRRLRPYWLALLAAAFVVLALLVAACGGGSLSPGVASVSSSTTALTQAGGSPSGGPESTGTSGSGSLLAYAACMRSHGVSDFPDPDSSGNIPINTTPQELGVSDTQYQAAQSACQDLLPKGGGGGGARTGGDQQKLALGLEVARCMRTHGFPTYPDPSGPDASSQGSGTRFEGTGIDTKSPRFQAAETNCEKQAREALGLPAAGSGGS